MARRRIDVLPAVGGGLVAGLVGTAAMTAWQKLASRLQRSSPHQPGRGDEKHDPWKSAPAPARVAKRLLEGVFERHVPADKIDLLANVTHWSYGTAWGAVYGVLQGTLRANPLAHGLVFGTGVWAMSYVELVPMGLYDPPWTYRATTLAKDVSYHIVYGAAVAGAYEVLEVRFNRRHERAWR